jgi:hypothetical protein
MLVPFSRGEYGSSASEASASAPQVQSSATTLFITFLYPAKSLIRNGVAVSDNLFVQFLEEYVFGVT